MTKVFALSGIVFLTVLCLLTGCRKDNNKEGFSSFTVKKNVVYATARNHQDKQQSLALDVYLPQNGGKANPLLVVMHSGGFYSGNREDLAEFCQFFAQRDFTTVTISYRLGWDMGNSTDFCGGNSYSVIQAGYRATQDLHAALRYLVANANSFNIDTSKIFIGGASAGAITALTAAFVSQIEFNQTFPQLESELGGLKNTGNTLSNTYQLKGVLNMWGGIIHPSMINPSEHIPVIGFHGSSDPVVPYQKGRFAGCMQYPEFYGSKAIFDVLAENGQPAVLHTEKGGGHGVYSLNYLAQNSYCFLKHLIGGQKPFGTYTNSVSNCP